MRLLVIVVILVLAPSMVFGGSSSGLKGDYLGQKPPGETPQLFAPGIVSIDGRYEYGVAFSPDGTELFFTAEGSGDNLRTGLLVMRRVGDEWTKPVVANLRGDGSWEQEAFYTVDGKHLFFCSPVAEKEWKLWSCEKDKNGWGYATLLESPVNTEAQIVFYATFKRDGTMFYTNVMERKIYVAPLVDGGYPATAPAEIVFGGHSFVHPDGDFLLLDSKGDIWVTFPGTDGRWADPVKLDDSISSDITETCPSLSPDGKFIFFARYNEPGELSNIYWVSSAIIGRLRP
jgi:hypothetical protein